MLKGLTAFLALGLGLLGLLWLDDPKASFIPFLLAGGLASAGWLLAKPPPRGFVFGALALAYGAALLRDPSLSDDVYRYIYEGRVVWRMGPVFPFLHPPAAAPALGVPPALLDDAWRHINHADLPTIYPPFAELVFAAAGGIGDLIGGHHLFVLKLLLSAAAFIAAAFAERTRSGAAFTILSSPLLFVEVAREGHADSLAMLGFSIGIFGFLAAKPRTGYAGFALAALAKLNGLAAMLAALRSTRKGALLGAALASLILLPLLFGGPAALTGTAAYATSWRWGDGVFTIVLWISEAILGGDWTRIGAFTLTRHELARGLTVLMFVGASYAVLRRPFPAEKIAERAGLLLLLALLFAPSLHPWYALWILPFVPFAGPASGAMRALLVLAPVLHQPADLSWVRALVHGTVWLILALSLRRE